MIGFRGMKNRALSFSVRHIVQGRATAHGTARFVEDSKLPLHHMFTKSNLKINPIIHGPPLAPNVLLSQRDQYLETAVKYNRSNCFYVYSENSCEHINGELWHYRKMENLLKKTQAKRENFVLMANLGLCSPEPLGKRIREAAEMCDVSNLDFVVVEVSAEDSFSCKYCFCFSSFLLSFFLSQLLLKFSMFLSLHSNSSIDQLEATNARGL